MVGPSRTIVGTGLFALDIVVSSDGRLISSGLGGSAGNVLAILAALEWLSVPVATLGQDAAGNQLIGEFQELRANVEFLRSAKNMVTPVIYQHQLSDTPGKTHSFSFSCPSCGQKRSLNTAFFSADQAEWVHANTRADVFYLDRPTRLGVELAEHYRKQGALIFFEPSSAGQNADLFSRALRCAHIVKYADDRLDDLEHFPTDDVAVEIRTMGKEGLRFRAPSLDHGWVQLDAFDAPWVVDTAGAGDWCTAGMVYNLFEELNGFNANCLNYQTLSRALRFGQALSAMNCMTVGARGLTKSLSVHDIIKTAHHLTDLKLKAETRTTAAVVADVDAYELVRPFKKAAKSASGLQGNSVACCGVSF